MCWQVNTWLWHGMQSKILAIIQQLPDNAATTVCLKYWHQPSSICLTYVIVTLNKSCLSTGSGLNYLQKIWFLNFNLSPEWTAIVQKAFFDYTRYKVGHAYWRHFFLPTKFEMLFWDNVVLQQCCAIAYEAKFLLKK